MVRFIIIGNNKIDLYHMGYNCYTGDINDERSGEYKNYSFPSE